MAENCFPYFYPFDADGITFGQDFLIRAVFEEGTAKFFSGIRIIIVHMDNDDIAEGEVGDEGSKRSQIKVINKIRTRNSRFYGIPCKAIDTIPRDTENREILSRQELGCQLTTTLHELSSVYDSLPLYVAIFGLIVLEDSDALRYPMVKLQLLHSNADYSSTITLYEYAERWGPNSEKHGVTLFLGLENASFNRHTSGRHYGMYWKTIISAVYGFALHIMPPAPRQQPISLPPELLHIIFSKTSSRRLWRSWKTKYRMEAVSWALVCHSWEGPALDYLYEDFSDDSDTFLTEGTPSLNDLAWTLRTNPSLGRRIRRFASNAFREVKMHKIHERDVANCLVDVLKNTPLIRDLSIPSIPSEYAPRLIDAICGFTDNLQSLIVNISEFRGEEEAGVTPVETSALAKILSHTSTLKRIEISSFQDSEATLSTAPTCTLHTFRLEKGSISFSHFQFLTSSSVSSLRVVTLKEVMGLSNNDLLGWLPGISETLQHLDLTLSKFPLEGTDEQFAIETVLPSMKRLKYLCLDDGMFSYAIFERFDPEPKGFHLDVGKPTLSLVRNDGPFIPLNVLTHAVVATKWERIEIRGVIDWLINLDETQRTEKDEIVSLAKRKGVELAFEY